MILIGGRVRSIRKSRGETLAVFGQHFGLSTSAISNIENGLNGVSNAFVLQLCRDFNVNEIWLRTGDGEPFAKRTREEDIAAFAGELIAGSDDFRKRLILALAKLEPEEWRLLESMAKKLAAEDK